MQTYNASSMNELLEIIGASGPDPSDRGPVVVRVMLEDGRIIEARYYRCEESELDARTKYDVFFDVEPLIPFVEKLLSEGKSFVTETGTHDMVCTLKWTIG